MTKSQFAILYSQEALFWKLCSDNEWPAGLQAKYRAFCKKVEAAKAQLPKPMNIIFTGFHGGEKISHYDIDKALKNEFKSKVRVDSESGQFFAHCNTKNRKDIVAWLTKNYPALDFNSEVDDDPQNPYFENWSAAERFCKKKGLKVTMPEEALFNEAKMLEVKMIEEQIQALATKKEMIISSL